jgi:hypothetical protein
MTAQADEARDLALRVVDLRAQLARCEAAHEAGDLGWFDVDSVRQELAVATEAAAEALRRL